MATSRVLQLANKHTGEVLEIERERRDGQVVLSLRGTLPPHRQGPPLHIHHLEDEAGVVRAGTLSAELGGKRLKAEAGEDVFLPKGIPHRWWNDGDVPLAFDGFVRPAVDLDKYLHGVFEVINASPSGRPSLFYMAHIARRHRDTQTILILPRPVQTILFEVVFLLGTVLGKYRGTDWPGCPARCTGAPELAPVSDA
jgi:mannose-6-phosphate isomerase-like protein (cupin superfamily)